MVNGDGRRKTIVFFISGVQVSRLAYYEYKHFIPCERAGRARA
jgi:hypothetical protein